MNRGRGCALFLVLRLILLARLQCVAVLGIQIQQITTRNRRTRSTSRLRPCILSSHESQPRQTLLKTMDTSGDGDEITRDSSSRRHSADASFLEQASLDGASAIASLSIEERTRRAMLAEATEDRMVLLADKLELLLNQDGMPLRLEDRDEVVVLAREIKALRDQYQSLVSGGPSYVLDSFDGGVDDSEEV